MSTTMHREHALGRGVVAIGSPPTPITSAPPNRRSWLHPYWALSLPLVALIGLAPAWPPIAGWTTPDPHTRARFQTVSPRSLLLTGTATGAVAARPIMLTDFSVRTPRAALATKPDPDHWQLIEYQADGVSGTMIGAKSLVTAPDVVLPLGVAGWHQIHVGYWNPYFEYDGELLLRLKLSGDSCLDRIQEGPPGEPAEQVHPGRTSLVEVFWRTEDLTGRHLTLGKFKGRKAYVAYVKLVPMSPEEVAKVKRERQRKRPPSRGINRRGGHLANVLR